MTNVSTLLRDLAERDIRITLKGDRLQLNAAEGALTEYLRSEIAARKAEIVTFLQEALDQPTEALTLYHAPSDQRLPLSFGQQRLWFLGKLNPDDAVYNLGVSVNVQGAIDEDAVRLGLNALVRRHDILRTIFNEVDGVPSQIVTDILPELKVVDMTHVPLEDKAAHSVAFGEAEVKRPFALETPPIRVTLIRVTADFAVLLVVVHHILADGWSLGMFVKEWRELYDVYRSGKEPQMPALPWQYADYAYSEQLWFTKADQRPHIQYWKQKLSGTPASLDLPVDRSPGRVLGSRGALHPFTIPAPLATELRSLSRENGVTLFTTLLSVFKALLQRYSGQSDIVVGAPVANRKPELESLIGLFVSTIVLRSDLSGDPTARELMKRVHNNVLDAHEHQDFPFEKLVELVRPDRNLAQSPLFQAAFILQNTPLSRTYDTIGGGSTFELSFYVWDGTADMPASFEYNADLFDANTIARMVGHFLALAESVVADPDRPLSTLPLLNTAERALLLGTWNETETTYPRHHPVHVLFEEQVDETPDAIALIAPGIDGAADESLSYRTLDQRANQLAHRLRRAGVGAGASVGIALPRSVDFVVAMVAVLKCGAAYVPVDPELPVDRIASMMTDADVSVVITRTDGRGIVGSAAMTIVLVDETSGTQPGDGEARLESHTTAESPVYVMFTSGSTGKPKAVVVPHRAVVRLVRNTNYVTLNERDVILACAPVSFDASTFELWGSLLNGGKLVLYPSAVPEPSELARFIRQYGVTTLWLTAGLFHLIAETKPETFAGLRQLLAGGDVLSPSHVRKALRVLREGVLINGYGPTENTTFTCCFRMSDAHEVGDSVPIGRPISNSTVYLLDAAMQPVPIGVRGELWTGGDGVALGYRNDPELTAKRFVSDPFVRTAGARMYRTGDIARYRADGVIEFVGRADQQVKIRGFRVEPGEIEQALCEYPSVRDAVVVARDTGAGHKRLLGYLIAKHASLAVADVKRFLQQRLPEYAIPSSLMIVPAFPLTPNGKVDYDALPAPAQMLVDEDEGPISPLEAQLIPLWEQVLGVTGIGRSDNFFEVGGNSLLALQLLANIEKATGQRVPATVLFQSQTVAAMAASLSEHADEDSSSRAIAIQKGGGRRTPVFVVPGVNGNVIGYERLANALGADQPVYGLRSVGLDGEATPLDRVEAIATAFADDIRRTQPQGPYYLVGFCMGGIIAYEVAQQLTAGGEKVEMLGLIDTWPPVAIPKKRWATRLGQQFIFVQAGMLRHLRALWQQPRGQRLQYLRKKSRIITEMVAQRDVYRGEQAVLNSDLVTRANQYAASKYVPRSYNGNVLLILTSDGRLQPQKDSRFVWQQLTHGECTVIPVLGKDSGSLLKPPFVQGLADALRARFAPSNGRTA